jgi:hypothetical protein
MRVFFRLGATLGLFAAFGLGCKDSGSPIVPNALASISGDGQSTLTGDELADPLTVRVMGSNGQPAPGATVTWTVTTGSATPGSATAVSDAQGLASTTLTLGATPGAIVVQAAVASITPVTFTATACDHPVVTLNDTVAGALATTDCALGPFYTDFYELTVPAGTHGVVLNMSGAFDTYIELYQRTGTFVGWDDGIDSVDLTSRLTAIVPAGDYLLAPSSADTVTVGAYSVSVLTQPAELTGCELVWVARGVSFSDSVTAGDCVNPSGPYYADVVELRLIAGTVLKVSEHSAAFDAALFLSGNFGTVASNNDSAATTTNAYLNYPVFTTGTYLLFVATNTVGATGAYDLGISTATTLAGSARREEGRQVLPMGGLRWPKGRAAQTWSRVSR